MSKPPKVILYDIETLPLLTATFSLYPDSIGHDNIISDWSIINICWKELQKPTIYSTSILDDKEAFEKDVNNDLVVIKKIRDVFEDADIIIGHNSKRYDTKRLNTRLIYWGLEPLPSGLHQVDTLQEIKKIAAFSSNRLDYLGKFLLGEGKTETSKGLWLRVLKGDRKAVKEMVDYCKKDVQLLEDLYLKILPYTKSHPHLGAMDGNDKNYTCPKCGGEEFMSKAIRYTTTGVKKVQKQCKACHSYTNFIYKEEKK